MKPKLIYKDLPLRKLAFSVELLLYLTAGCSSSLHAIISPRTRLTMCFCLQSGLALSVRNLGTMGVILYGTTLVSRMGAATLAAHEIMRQVFIFSIQLFSALDVTAQSMIGLQLGKVRLHGPILTVMCLLSR